MSRFHWSKLTDRSEYYWRSEFRDIRTTKCHLLVVCDLLSVKETETSFALIVPWLKRLSVTVGIEERVSGESVSRVRSTGPILYADHVISMIS